MKNLNCIKLFLLYSSIAISFCNTNAIAQEALLSDTTKLNEWLYYKSRNRNNDLYQDLLKVHDPLLYVAPAPQFLSLVNREIPLQDGEGKDGYWLEGNVAHRIIMYRGKWHSPAEFLKKTRVTFDANFLIRMTRDYSSPLLPNNNVFGLGIDYLLNPISDMEAAKSLYWVKFQAHHYSNGQQGAFFLNANPVRNNYKGGDFSSNYFRLSLQRAKVNEAGGERVSILSYGIGLQRDGDFIGPFKFSNEMKNYYGQNRILANLQWVRKPKYLFVRENEEEGRIFDLRRELGLRAELEYIIDDTSLYPHGNNYRLGLHTYAYIMPWVTNHIGFVLHNYLGRDYLNIRFDDPVFAAKFGLLFKI